MLCVVLVIGRLMYFCSRLSVVNSIAPWTVSTEWFDTMPDNVPEYSQVTLKSDSDSILLQSPDYPKPYKTNTKALYSIQSGDKKKALHLESIVFDLEEADSRGCNKTRLVIWDSWYGLSPLDVRCGRGPLNVTSYTSSVRIMFLSTDIAVGAGFSVKVTRACPAHYLKCPSNTSICVEDGQICDGQKDCPEGEDEICSMDCGTIPLNNNQSQPSTTRIAGGKPVEPGRQPWHVQLAYTIPGSPNFTQCGGSLVAPQWIMTSAYCCRSTDGNAMVPANLNLVPQPHYCLTTQPRQYYTAEAIYVHPGYYAENIRTYNDLCMIKTQLPIPFSDEVHPICLPYRHAKMFQQRSCFAAGCGGPSPPSQPTQTPVVLGTRDECFAGPIHFDHPTTICTKNGTANGVCRGDFGGPLTCPLDMGDQVGWYLAGVASFSYGCGRTTPAYFTRVEKLMNFMAETVYAENRDGWWTNTTVARAEVNRHTRPPNYYEPYKQAEYTVWYSHYNRGLQNALSNLLSCVVIVRDIRLLTERLHFQLA